MPNSSTQFVDRANTRAMRLARYESSLMRKTIPLLRSMERDLMSQLRASDLTDFQVGRLGSMLAQTQEVIRKSYAAVGAEMVTELNGLGQIESNWTSNALIQSTGLSASVIDTVTVAAASQTNFMGSPLMETLERQAFGVRARFSDQVRIGMGLGETITQISARVKDTGVFQTARTDLNRLTRNAVNTVSTNARMATYEANADVIEGLEHISTIDGKTSVICIVRDGLRWTLDRDPIGHNVPFRQPPTHHNCRSGIVPWLKPWQDLGIPEDQIPAKTRASMDGQIPEETSYETWLKGRSVTKQDEILGGTRAKLWREDKITLREMVNAQGDRPLTLEQLGVDD
jgi:SPP1 gp7 family putative phage head morphogenesis protein